MILRGKGACASAGPPLKFKDASSGRGNAKGEGGRGEGEDSLGEECGWVVGL